MKEHHLFVHRRPAEVTSGKTCVDSLELETFALSGASWQQPFDWSFEVLVERLERLGASCEWDGAWGWYPISADDGQVLARVGGTAHCLDQRVMCLEVFASWTRAEFRTWAASVVGPDLSPEQQLLVQLLPSGHFLSCSSYERWLHRNECITC